MCFGGPGFQIGIEELVHKQRAFTIQPGSSGLQSELNTLGLLDRDLYPFEMTEQPKKKEKDEEEKPKGEG